MRRSTKEEYQRIREDIRVHGGTAADMSPERINRMLKKLPPFKHDEIPEEDLDYFSQKSEIGWSYLT